MKKCMLILIIILATIFLSCQSEEPDTPEMTAPEVCQYVTQALPDKYVYEYPTLRIEYKYQAKSAYYKGQGVWRVKVVIEGEWKRLYEGQWSFFSMREAPYKQTWYYAFNESTGEVTRIK